MVTNTIADQWAYSDSGIKPKISNICIVLWSRDLKVKPFYLCFYAENFPCFFLNFWINEAKYYDHIKNG